MESSLTNDRPQELTVTYPGFFLWEFGKHVWILCVYLDMIESMAEVFTVTTSLLEPFTPCIGVRLSLVHIPTCQDAVALTALGTRVTSWLQFITKGGLEPVLYIVRNILCSLAKDLALQTFHNFCKHQAHCNKSLISYND